MQILKDLNKDQWLAYKSKVISSTEISSIFGISPYATEFEIWHRKANASIISISENQRILWGSRLESAIANGVAQDNNWDIRPMKEFYYDPKLRIGSSFDYCIVDKGVDKYILEIKNVDSLIFKDGWIVDEEGDIEAPPHIEIQVQFQLMISGLKEAYIACLVGGNTVQLIKRSADEDIKKMMLTKVAKFWESVDAGVPPEPNFEKDAEFICSLYNVATVGKVADEKDNEELKALALEYKMESDIIKNAQVRKDAAKAKMLTIIEDSEKALGSGFSISAGIIGPTTVSYERKGYRNFKVYFKKEAQSE